MTVNIFKKFFNFFATDVAQTAQSSAIQETFRNVPAAKETDNPYDKFLINTPEAKNPSMTGTELYDQIKNLDGQIREQIFINNFIDGNIPNFFRNLIEVNVRVENNEISYFVLPDYLSLGTDDDFLRIPLSSITGQKIANLYNCTLPTKKMVMDIWKAAAIKLNPSPWIPGQGESRTAQFMNSSKVYLKHHQNIEKQRDKSSTGQLVAGHMKDTCLTNQLNIYKNNVAIFGWIYKNGNIIQGLNAQDHIKSYYDYSQGIRLICNDVLVNDTLMKIQDVFKDKELSKLVSDENPLTFIKY